LRNEATVPAGQTYEKILPRMQDMVVMKANGLAIPIIDHFATGGAAIGVKLFDRL
jgi:hypothetical protein